eukprot:366372-Chlamydomonas_euryale.AAC.2
MAGRGAGSTVPDVPLPAVGLEMVRGSTVPDAPLPASALRWYRTAPSMQHDAALLAESSTCVPKCRLLPATLEI